MHVFKVIIIRDVGEFPLLYEKLAEVYQKIESTSGTLDKIALFSEFLKDADASVIDKIIALTIGKLHPDWQGYPEIGIAEKTTIQVVATSAGVPESKVESMLHETGDIGLAAESLLSGSVQSSLFAEDPTITRVYDTLDNIAQTSGAGSNKEKISQLVGLLSDASPIEAKYLLRTVIGDLRLGLAEMSIIDSLSIAFTDDKSNRDRIESAFNVRSDLACVAKELAEGGLDAIKKIHAMVGIPIRMMAAKKLTNATDILEKGGKNVLVEYKYDGERVQVHKSGETIKLFSRRQEEISTQYPDVVKYVLSNINAETCIIEGEIVAIDPQTGSPKPFQELMKRKRKTEISEMMEEIPIALYFFDILYLNGKDVMSKSMLERRKLLEEVVNQTDRVNLTKAEETSNPERLDTIFEVALATGYEGVIAKATHKDSIYQAGSRSWLWIKLKASYKEGMSDSIDLVIVGALFGRGKRTGLYGAILAAAYDERTDSFPTVCKIGTGFTDEMLVEFKDKLEEHLISGRDPRVVSDIEADVWFNPVEVIEVLGDEITISPIHPAGRDRLKEGGLAIRFPRFTGRWREDKDPHQATTVSDLIEMYDLQSKQK